MNRITKSDLENIAARSGLFIRWAGKDEMYGRIQFYDTSEAMVDGVPCYGVDTVGAGVMFCAGFKCGRHPGKVEWDFIEGAWVDIVKGDRRPA